MLTVGVLFDPDSGKLDVVNFQPGPEYQQAVMNWLEKKNTLRKTSSTGAAEKTQPSPLGL